LGPLALAHNGNLVNTSNLREVAKPTVTTTTTDSELIAFALAGNAGIEWLEGAIRAFQRCQGAFSLVIGTQQV